MRRFLPIIAGFGVLVPIGCWIGSAVFKITFGTWTMVVWPSSIFLMATAGRENSAAGVFICGLAVITNVLVYTCLGLVVALGVRLLGKRSDASAEKKGERSKQTQQPGSGETS